MYCSKISLNFQSLFKNAKSLNCGLLSNKRKWDKYFLRKEELRHSYIQIKTKTISNNVRLLGFAVFQASKGLPPQHSQGVWWAQADSTPKMELSNAGGWESEVNLTHKEVRRHGAEQLGREQMRTKCNDAHLYKSYDVLASLMPIWQTRVIRERKPQLRKCFYLISIWSSLWYIFTDNWHERAQITMGSAIMV